MKTFNWLNLTENSRKIILKPGNFGLMKVRHIAQHWWDKSGKSNRIRKEKFKDDLSVQFPIIFIPCLHCNKTLRGIPPPWLDGAGVNSEGKGKWFPCQARVYTPPNTELFRRLRNFPEIYCVKKRQSGRSVGSNSHPMDNWSWPIPLDHSNLVLQNIKHNILATPLTFPAWRNVK